MEAKHVVYSFVNEYYEAMCNKAAGLSEFIALHSCPASRTDVSRSALSAISHHECHTKPRSFISKDFSVEILCVDFLESFNQSITVMVVGSLHKEEGQKHLFAHTFIIPQHQESIEWHYNDMLWSDSPSATPPLHMSNGDCLSLHRQVNDEVEPYPVENELKMSKMCSNEEGQEVLHYENEQNGSSEVRDKLLDTMENIGEINEESAHARIPPPAENSHLEETISNGSTPAEVCRDQVFPSEGIESEKNINDKAESGKHEGEVSNVEHSQVCEDVEKSSSVDEDAPIFTEEEFPSAFPCLTSARPSLAPSNPDKVGSTGSIPTNLGIQQPKFSYASVLNVASSRIRVDNSTSTTSKPYVKSPPMQASSPIVSASTNASTKVEGIVGSSVYVRNLPRSITLARLNNEFKLFGPLKVGGGCLRNHQVGPPFAFVDFKDVSSAQKAIKASPIMIDDHEVYIEEKKRNAHSSSFQKAGSNKWNGSTNYRGNSKDLVK